jgi:hypothetical protein
VPTRSWEHPGGHFSSTAYFASFILGRHNSRENFARAAPTVVSDIAGISFPIVTGVLQLEHVPHAFAELVQDFLNLTFAILFAPV